MAKEEQPKVDFAALKKENEAYGEKLSKRSAQYIYELRKRLSEKMNVERQEVVLNEILPTLVAGQKEGKTAKQLLGTVDDCAQRLIEGPKKEPKEMPFWQMWLDNALMVFAILGAMSGIFGLFPSKPMMMGMTSMILSAIFGGFVFCAMYYFIYRYDRPGADKSKKPKLWKSLLIITALMLLWMAVLQLSMVYLPVQWNLALNPIWTLVVAAAAYGIRSLLKRYLGYSGSFFNRA